MRIQARYAIVVTITLITCFCIGSLLYLHSGTINASAPDEDYTVPEEYISDSFVKDDVEQKSAPRKKNPGAFYARLNHRRDVYQTDVMLMQIKITPALAGHWPDFPIIPNVHTEQTVIQSYIQIRGVNAHPQRIEWSNPFYYVETQKQGDEDGCEYTWNMLGRSRVVILENPEKQSGSKAILCDVYVVIGGVKVDFAEAIRKEGHIVLEEYK